MNRKDFIKTGAAAGAAAVIPGVLGAASGAARAQAHQKGVLPKFSGGAVKGSGKVKVAIVGIGGRGTGALQNMFDASQDIELVAVGDAFSYPVERAKKIINEKIEKKYPGKFKDFWKVGDNVFIGLDAIDRVVKTDADVVILATPPIFRPAHIRKCLENNKHVFAEKPICIDAAGLRKVLDELIPMANAKKLSVLCGTQMRYQSAIREGVERVRDGQIGDIVSAQFLRYEPTYLCAGIWGGKVDPSLKPEDAEFQLKNWLAFVWPSGGQFVEQYIHNLDMALWAIGQLPDEVVGSGGRQSDLPYPQMGNRYSTYSVNYEFANGVWLAAGCRQEFKAAPYATFKVYGTKGTLEMSFGKQVIKGEKPCVIPTPKKQALVCEHEVLLNAIREGKPVNTMKQCADSCYVAIAGREAAFSGKRFKCEWLLKRSKQNLLPENFRLGMKLPIAPVPSPSTYKLV